MRLGVAKRDITPWGSVPLAGFASRNGKGFDGIDKRLYVRTFYFERRTETNAVEKALLAIADILFWDSRRVKALQRMIHRTWGIPEEAIILHATHTHSGPSVSYRTIHIGDPVPEYVSFLETETLASVEAAIACAEPVTIERGVGSCDIGVNRRVKIGDAIEIGLNESGIRDQELTVVRFAVEGTNRTKALLTHYACHPTVTNANRVSSEFIGVAMDLLEEQEGGVSGYLQGCCGDINPAVRSDLDTVDSLGRRLADSVRLTLRSGLESVGPAAIRYRRVYVDLPFDRLPAPEQLRDMLTSAQPPEIRAWAERLLDEPDALSPSIPLELGRVDIADGLALLSMSGEMVVEYGLFIKQLSGNKIIPVAYSNGMSGYVTTAKQREEGGYEPIGSTLYFGLPAPFRHDAERMVLHSLSDLIDGQH
ncbi:hypothetical protein FE782_00575 [Paenibacillus antri]|uniref:Neutral/alkaline non-lysosomal ceramidase N-terminal domain-containing protein n=1 Tax=Paenibacillus antri TaxID=2582848 RepID=A0A5R9GHE6_9BACL|nr:neutral/alkaline non-lysosomal ceramidase N-terminal domain-containing protein [Paenibacillus antri]TLS53886.1 hypothetical protein FE782_00575 [Paenibacillus antri]